MRQGASCKTLSRFQLKFAARAEYLPTLTEISRQQPVDLRSSNGFQCVYVLLYEGEISRYPHHERFRKKEAFCHEIRKSNEPFPEGENSFHEIVAKAPCFHR